MATVIITRTVSTCDIPGCGVSDDVEGAFSDRVPEGWMENVANVKLVCTAHAKQVRIILAGKKKRSDAGKPRQRALEAP